MNNKSNHQHNCQLHSSSMTAVQSLDEMDFERGIWSAVLNDDIDRLYKLIKQGCLNSTDNSGYTALHYAVRCSNLKILNILIEAGANVNCQTNNGATPLHRAAMMGFDDIVQLLLINNADVNTKDIDGRTAVHRAALNGHTNVIKILLENNQKLKYSIDNFGKIPYDLIPEKFNELKSILSIS